MKEKDYSHLVGTEIKTSTELTEKYGYDAKLVVSEIDPDIGVTIHVKGDPNDRAYCVVNPWILKKRRKIQGDLPEYVVESWEKMFPHFLELIESQYLDRKWVEKCFEILILASPMLAITGSKAASQQKMAELCPFK